MPQFRRTHDTTVAGARHGGPMLCLILTLFFVAPFDPTAHAEELSFNRDIRPILSANCFACHGPDAKKREADLRLDIREEAVAVRDGVAAIRPGAPDDSEMIRRILTKEADDVMPPPKAHLPALPQEKIDTLKRWISEGAPYDAHWSFVPPKKAAVPAGTHPVDYFINQRLTKENLAPSPAADAETLVRRLFLDLTGLPPSIKDIDAFLNDTSLDRRDRLIVRLMDSLHFSERMALPWLDGARYSDTHGYSGGPQKRSHGLN